MLHEKDLTPQPAAPYPCATRGGPCPPPAGAVPNCDTYFQRTHVRSHQAVFCVQLRQLLLTHLPLVLCCLDRSGFLCTRHSQLLL